MATRMDLRKTHFGFLRPALKTPPAMDLRCQYNSKPCAERRFMRSNGTYHRLCAFHRDRANEAQRRWHARKRATASPRSPVTANNSEDDETPTRKCRSAPYETKHCRRLPLPEVDAKLGLEPVTASPGSNNTLSDEELALLWELIEDPVETKSFSFTSLLDSSATTDAMLWGTSHVVLATGADCFFD